MDIRYHREVFEKDFPLLEQRDPNKFDQIMNNLGQMTRLLQKSHYANSKPCEDGQNLLQDNCYNGKFHSQYPVPSERRKYKLDHYVYPALFESEEGIPGFTVTFPDLPGCITEGDTIEESLSMAKEALAFHLYSMEEDGDDIPTASDPVKLPRKEDGFYSLIEVRTGLIRDKL